MMIERSEDWAIIPDYMAEKLSLQDKEAQCDFLWEWLGWEVDLETFHSLEFYRTEIEGHDGIYYTYEAIVTF